MIKYIQNCSFVRYMKYDYFKAPKWLRKFYDFVAKRINLFLNWYWENQLPYLTKISFHHAKRQSKIPYIGQAFKGIYTEDTDYYIDFLWMPKPPEYYEKIKPDSGNWVWIDFCV